MVRNIRNPLNKVPFVWMRFLTLLIMFLLFISIFGIVLLHKTELDVKEALGREMEYSASAIIENVQTRNNLQANELRFLLEDATIRAALRAAREQALNGTDEEWLADGPLVHTVLSSPASQVLVNALDKNGFSELIVADAQGRLIAASGKTSDYEQADEKWWQHAAEGEIHVGNIGYDESAGISSIEISIGTYDDSGLLGVAKGVMNLQQFENILSRYQTQEATAYIMIAEDGLPVVFGNKKKSPEEYLRGVVFDENTDSKFVIDKINNKERIYAYIRTSLIHNDEKKTSTFFIINEDLDGNPTINDLHNSLATLIIVSFLGAIFVILSLNSSVAQPLKKLGVMARELGAGNKYPRVTKNRKDEIGILEKEIRSMADKMSESQEQALKMEEEQRKKLTKEVEKKTVELTEFVDHLKKSRTATYNMMEDLQEANLELEKKDEIKTDFLNMISHELKTPLTPIKAHLDLLTSKSLGPTTKLQDKSLQTLARNATRLEGIIKNLLEISRIEAGKIILEFEKIAVNDFVKEITDEFKTACEEKGLKLEFVQSKVPTITADKDRIKECILNYLNNSLKFTEKGKLTVKTSTTGEQVKISVTDTGRGVNKNNLKNLFQKFYQEGKTEVGKAKGVGLGLYSVRKIIELHGGTVGAESSSAGSTFWLMLPTKQKQKNK